MAGFARVFVANRGEVAVRIARACEALDIEPVLGVSAADADAAYTKGRRTVLLGGARSSESYLRRDALINAAISAGCSALHPGWGFVAEDPVFASMCEAAGVTFIGPPAHVMALLGKKTPAKAAMSAAGLTTIGGSVRPVADEAEAAAVAKRIGYPVLLKAESGGGGRGMRIAESKKGLRAAYQQAQAEARGAFGDDRLFVEKLITGARHIEIQVLADRYGHAIHLGERDCTVQRNHQKLIEESPAALADDVRERVLRAAVVATERVGYVGAGTLEFLQDAEGELYFMEMNTRLQVEHPVSEMRTGIDLVQAQIRVAQGEPLWLSQGDVSLEGHAIECRINAEDPQNDFAPSPGVIERFVSPAADDGVRVDTHVDSGYEVPSYYDSLICKVITHAKSREAARNKMLKALKELTCDGVKTTVPLHQAVLSSKAFIDNDYTTGAIPGWE